MNLTGLFWRNISRCAFNHAKGDWVLEWMLSFFSRKDIPNIKRLLKKYSTSPAIAFPQYQFFTPDRYQLKQKYV